MKSVIKRHLDEKKEAIKLLEEVISLYVFKIY